MHSDIEPAFDKIIAPKRKVIEHETDMKMRIGRPETRDRVPSANVVSDLGQEFCEPAGSLCNRLRAVSCASISLIICWQK
jgi:hypothetical protein